MAGGGMLGGVSAEVCAKDNPAFPHNHALIALHCFLQLWPKSRRPISLHCFAQSLSDSISLHCSITPKLHCTEIVVRLLQLGIAQIELQSIGVGKYRHGGRHGNSRSDWFVEHRIATWGHRTMVPISGARHQSSGDQMGTNWVSREGERTPAGGISGTCTHLLCATQCLTDGQMSPNVFPLKAMNTAAVVDLCWHPLGLSPQQGFPIPTE